MLEKALTGGRRYWTLLAVLSALVAIGLATYLRQFSVGLGITGLSRDVAWGLYISQFTFMVGVAASAVMVVLPYYVHHYKAFGRLAILGEFLAGFSLDEGVAFEDWLLIQREFLQQKALLALQRLVGHVGRLLAVEILQMLAQHLVLVHEALLLGLAVLAVFLGAVSEIVDRGVHPQLGSVLGELGDERGGLGTIGLGHGLSPT